MCCFYFDPQYHNKIWNSLEREHYIYIEDIIQHAWTTCIQDEQCIYVSSCTITMLEVTFLCICVIWSTVALAIDSREKGLETKAINTNQQIQSALHYNNRKSISLFRILSRLMKQGERLWHSVTWVAPAYALVWLKYRTLKSSSGKA